MQKARDSQQTTTSPVIEKQLADKVYITGWHKKVGTQTYDNNSDKS